ncbi:MAG TPA: chromosome segregation protein SMC [Acidobacteriaceae bacterium]|nr:chromosome segregation protein SMC [Acidobacteriaceae bacterium]
MRHAGIRRDGEFSPVLGSGFAVGRCGLLKLKRVQILGFKSFCDRTEVHLSGEGIAAVVGPNGCGKSNISDAVTWVLGEQSAKSLRGTKMEDVIFAGTRERKPTGMAEVTLTLVDPEVYDGASAGDAPAEGDWSSEGGELSVAGDWNEAELRKMSAEETEAAVAEAQPGVVLGMDGAPVEGEASGAANSDPAHGDAIAVNGSPDAVVLKIRRRKFNRSPVRAGEITITRRLFRSGDSEYLLNGKICRLRDIQDIFMGTGLGGESYAIIGQERIGQILSSKPMDRRAILEEAAGITRFKTKKRLAELRLESAKVNLARVNDIFEEVTRQMGSLKRQAAKAERYGLLRDELRGRLRVVLASRMQQMDAERSSLAEKIAALTAKVEEQSAAVEAMDAEHTTGVQHGYELEQQVREAGAKANQAAVDMERMTARMAANTDRVAELTARVATSEAELEPMREQLRTLAGELETQRSFLENATAEAAGSREAAETRQREAQEAVRAVGAAEQQAEQARRNAMQLMGRAAACRNEQSQTEAALAGLESESERLATESDAARRELEQLGVQRGQVALTFGDVTERLKALEAEIADLRARIESVRSQEMSARKRGNELRAERASLEGRKSSLDALIKEHSYSTETVRNIFKANAAANGHGFALAGTLADFLEVDGQYEGVVDEFLRDELNFVVVKSWDAADAGVRMLDSDVAGRATFLVHPEDGAHGHEHDGHGGTAAVEGAVALKDCVRVLNGFGNSLEKMLPKLRDGYIAPDATTARRLASEHPRGFFLSPSGEAFHNATVTGGRVRAQGPLSLKRELNEVQQKLDASQAALAQAEIEATTLERELRDLTATLDAKTLERRDAERESANSGAALRQMEAEAARMERRLQEWTLANERNRDARARKQEIIEQRRHETAGFEAEKEGLEAQIAELQQQLDGMRQQRETLQAVAAEASAALAALEERRRNAAANCDQTQRMFDSQKTRISQVEQQIESAGAEKVRREQETTELAAQHGSLSEVKATALAEASRLGDEANELRARMTELDGKLRSLRHETEVLREERAGLTARTAKLVSDIEHIEAACVNDLSADAATLRADETIVRIEGEALGIEEEAARELKQKLEAMGPVNMMALEEYKETAERHTFLETQRKDLIESIENTQASIKEIDDVSRVKFDEAFKVINENFSVTFTKLFGGGQAFMRLTDEENAAESGIDIVASPPGKKLQNVLLLSGGEKALTALSLLVGIFQFQPAPFCLLDEVDAPLDETNVGRFAKLIAEMSATTQFIVITHSKRTMEQADVIYGVTMQEPGVSKIVSVNLSKDKPARDERSRRAVA